MLKILENDTNNNCEVYNNMIIFIHQIFTFFPEFTKPLYQHMCYTIHKVWLRVPQHIALNLSGDGTSIAPDPCPHPSKCSKLTLWINRLSCIFNMVEENLPIKPSKMLKTDSKHRIFMWYLHHGWRNFFKSNSLICSTLTLELRFFIDISTVAEENFQIQLSHMLKIDS